MITNLLRALVSDMEENSGTEVVILNFCTILETLLVSGEIFCTRRLVLSVYFGMAFLMLLRV